VGKSAFVVSAAHQVRASYPGGIFYASLLTPEGDPVSPVDVLTAFLTAVGLPQGRESASLQDLRRLFRSWTASRKVLVVLDDAVDIKQLEPLLPSGPGCATLVAGRRLLSHPAIGMTVPLRPLVAEEAKHMLSDMVGGHRLAGDAEAVREVVELCDGLPLALRAVANVLQLRPHWRIGRLLARMRGEQRQLAKLCTEGVSVADSVELTYRLLPTADQAAFRLVGGSAVQPVSPLDAAAVLGVDEAEAEALLEDLVEFQLAEVIDVGVGDSFRYRFLPLLRGVAHQLSLCADTRVTS
jgi:NB-ARC domain